MSEQEFYTYKNKQITLKQTITLLTQSALTDQEARELIQQVEKTNPVRANMLKELRHLNKQEYPQTHKYLVEYEQPSWILFLKCTKFAGKELIEANSLPEAYDLASEQIKSCSCNWKVRVVEQVNNDSKPNDFQYKTYRQAEMELNASKKQSMETKQP